MKRIHHCLNPQLIDICERAIIIEELNLKVNHYLPKELAEHCYVTGFSRGCLTIQTAHAQWATLLRFALPELRDQLRKDAGFYQLASIKIHLQTSDVRIHNPVKTSSHPYSEPKKIHYPPLKKALESLKGE